MVYYIAYILIIFKDASPLLQLMAILKRWLKKRAFPSRPFLVISDAKSLACVVGELPDILYDCQGAIRGCETRRPDQDLLRDLARPEAHLGLEP